MSKQRSLWDIVPPGSVIGIITLIGMAVYEPLRPFLIYVSLLVILYTMFKFLVQVGDAEERIKTLKLPEKQIKVQPQGPSFQEVLRAIPDPIMIVSGYEPNDIAGRWIVFANTAAMKTFQMEREGGVLVSTIRNPEVLECVDEALFGGITSSTYFETSGGAREQYWHAFSSPLPVGSPGPGEQAFQRLALLVIRDETDVRRMERMRADFLANASHELRTPLASITGFIETLRGAARDDERARDKFLAIMSTQADRMGRLIADLLSLSRIEMSEHVPPSGEADLVHAVRDVIEGLTLIAAEKNVRFVVRGPAPGRLELSWSVIGDRDQILQVIQNLVDNALKYAPNGSEICVDIRFDLTPEEAMAGSDSRASRLVLLRPDRNVHDHYARVTVRDNGPGIRREFLPRLAERFYRVEGQKSGDRLGTGLGLAIVKHIINRHRGGLVVESQAKVLSGDDDLSLIRTDEADTVSAPSVQEGPPTYTAFSAWFPQKQATGMAVKTAQGPLTSAI